MLALLRGHRIAISAFVLCLSPALDGHAAPLTGEANSETEPEAASETQPLRVSFTGPAECGAPGNLAGRTRELLGAVAQDARVQVQAEVVALASGGYQLDMTLSGRVEGQRRLEAKTCPAVLEVGAVVLALAIDPSLVNLERGSEAEPTKEATLPSAAVEVREEPPTVDVAEPPAGVVPPRPRQWRVFAGGGLGVVSGLLPGVGLGPRLNAGFATDRWRLALDVAAQLPTQVNDADAGEVGFWAVGAAALGCLDVAEFSTLTLPLCAGVQLTRVRGQAVDLEAMSAQSAWLTSVVARGGFRWALWPRFSVVLDAGVQLPTTQPRFVARAEDGTVSIFQSGVGASAGLGVETSF